MNWLNNARTLAIVSVLMIHISAPYMVGEMNETWWVANVFDSLSRLAVPLFLIISGALLLNKEEPIKQYFTKRISKIVLPFLLWSVFYFLYKTQEAAEVLTFFKQFFSSGIYYHLWYFYMIIPLYLIIPILRKVVQHIPTSYIMTYAIISGFVPLIQGNLGLIGWGISIQQNPFVSGIAYLLLGYVVAHRDIKIPGLSIYAALSSLVIIFGTYFATNFTGRFSDIYYNGFSLPVMILTLGVFIAFREVGKKHPGKNILSNIISKHSFGIYLIHPVILVYLDKYLVFESHTYAMNGLLMVTKLIVLLFASLLIVAPLSNIPVLKRIV